MTLEVGLLLFFGLVILAGTVFYFAMSVDRTAGEINAIRTSAVGQFLLGLG